MCACACACGYARVFMCIDNASQIFVNKNSLERNHTSSIYNRTPTSCCCYNACACLEAQSFYLFTFYFLFCSQNRTPALPHALPTSKQPKKMKVHMINIVYRKLFGCIWLRSCVSRRCSSIKLIQFPILTFAHQYFSIGMLSLFCPEIEMNSFVLYNNQKRAGVKHFWKMNRESMRNFERNICSIKNWYFFYCISFCISWSWQDADYHRADNTSGTATKRWCILCKRKAHAWLHSIRFINLNFHDPNASINYTE